MLQPGKARGQGQRPSTAKKKWEINKSFKIFSDFLFLKKRIVKEVICDHLGKKGGSLQPHFSLVPMRLKSPTQCHRDSMKAGTVVLPVANGIAHQIAHMQFLSPFVVREGPLASRL